jgi:hypothetical protein
MTDVPKVYEKEEIEHKVLMSLFGIRKIPRL